MRGISEEAFPSFGKGFEPRGHSTDGGSKGPELVISPCFQFNFKMPFCNVGRSSLHICNRMSQVSNQRKPAQD